MTNTAYFRSAKYLYERVVNDDAAGKWTPPLWGTCLGFETICCAAITNVSSDGTYNCDNVLSGGYDSMGLPLPLNLTDEAPTSRFLGTGTFGETSSSPVKSLSTSLSSTTLSYLTSTAATPNFHEYGVNPANFSKFLSPKGLVALSVNTDRHGKPFVSTLEHKTAPITAVQWHPEAYTLPPDHEGWTNGTWHGKEAIRRNDPLFISAMLDVSRYFVQQCRDRSMRFQKNNVSTVASVSVVMRPDVVDRFPLDSEAKNYLIPQTIDRTEKDEGEIEIE